MQAHSQRHVRLLALRDRFQREQEHVYTVRLDQVPADLVDSVRDVGRRPVIRAAGFRRERPADDLLQYRLLGGGMHEMHDCSP